MQLSEFIYNPPKFNGIDGDEFEFLELKNTGTVPLELSGVTFTDAIRFTFTNETVLGPGQYFVLGRNAAQFAAKYPGAVLNGLYTGKLENNGENVVLSTSLGGLIFSVTYDNAAPWPAEADNSGLSLQRINFGVDVTNTTSWIAAPPTPGGPLLEDSMDTDGDGMPDGWENLHGLNRSGHDANEDPDRDGLTDYQEFLAGTNPRDDEDNLRLQASIADPFTVLLTFSARSNKTYSIVNRSTAESEDWITLLNVSSQPTNRVVVFSDGLGPNANSRFFRLTTPRLP